MIVRLEFTLIWKYVLRFKLIPDINIFREFEINDDILRDYSDRLQVFPPNVRQRWDSCLHRCPTMTYPEEDLFPESTDSLFFQRPLCRPARESFVKRSIRYTDHHEAH